MAEASDSTGEGVAPPGGGEPAESVSARLLARLHAVVEGTPRSRRPSPRKISDFDDHAFSQNA